MQLDEKLAIVSYTFILAAGLILRVNSTPSTLKCFGLRNAQGNAVSVDTSLDCRARAETDHSRPEKGATRVEELAVVGYRTR